VTSNNLYRVRSFWTLYGSSLGRVAAVQGWTGWCAVVVSLPGAILFWPIE
jgi:hypothetical protein